MKEPNKTALRAKPLLKTPGYTDPSEAGQEPYSGVSMMNKTGSDFSRGGQCEEVQSDVC